MKLAFSTNAFTRFSLGESMKMIRDLGYEGVEIMADQPHLWPLDAKVDFLQEVKETAQGLGLIFCNMNGFMMKAVGDIHHPSWIEPDARDRAMRIAHTEACLRAARILGVPGVSTEPGGPLMNRTRAQAFELFAHGLREVSPVAKNTGIKLLIEPEPDLLLEDLQETVSFVQGMDLECLGINFDLGHFYCLGQDPASLIRSFPGYLEHVHIEDIGEDRIHHHLIPGRGSMNFASIFEALGEVHYQGFITVELYPYEEEPLQAAKEAYRFLKPYLEG